MGPFPLPIRAAPWWFSSLPLHARATAAGDGQVTVNEIITLVNIALGSAEISTCPVDDTDGNGAITVNEIIGAVNKALSGCS
jgi:hypothetical protein